MFEKIGVKLGYDKKIPLVFNNRRPCGLWLLIVGVMIILSTVFGGKLLINPFIFCIGYVCGFYIALINKSIVGKLSYGKLSDFQNNVAFLSLIILFILIFVMGGSFIPSQNWRMVWLGAFLATGLHFSLYYFIHGKEMIYLSIVSSIIAIGGMILSNIPFVIFAVLDGAIKIMFGLILLFSRTPKRIDNLAK